MIVIVINLERGPEGHPVGRLRKESGQTVPFTGWLDLVRVLEDEPAPPGSRPAPAPRTASLGLRTRGSPRCQCRAIARTLTPGPAAGGGAGRYGDSLMSGGIPMGTKLKIKTALAGTAIMAIGGSAAHRDR